MNKAIYLIKRKRIIYWHCKKFYTVIQIQSIIHDKNDDFYDNYFKNDINDDLWLDDGVKLFYTISTYSSNSLIKLDKKKLSENWKLKI